MNKKLTIVTINFNNKAGLVKTFESIKSQRWSDFEYIVIDGGSNDGSKELIEENPQVCMMLPWVMLERQIIIYGKAVKVSRAESLKYFLTRPKESQLGAWVSHQSSVISGRKLLEMKLMELKNKFSKGEIPLPSFWGGYRIIPDTFEFWQGGPGRVHDRFMYKLQENGSWTIERLQP